MPNTLPCAEAPSGEAADWHLPLSRESLTVMAAIEIAAVLKALSDPVRLRLLSLIAVRGDGGSCVCDLGEYVDVSQPTISHHLKKLREAGVIDGERRGAWVHYRIRPATLERLSALLAVSPQAA